jgi:two-component system chemotaxis response regulator CheY
MVSASATNQHSSVATFDQLSEGIQEGRSIMAIDLTVPLLIVDDCTTMVRIIRSLLRQIGFGHINDANNGSQALAQMRERKHDLVISDWNIEPMTGFDLLQQVRLDPRLSSTPFIMVAAQSNTEDVIAAKTAGASCYIVKPFKAQTLKSKIASVFPDVEPAATPCRPHLIRN